MRPRNNVISRLFGLLPASLATGLVLIAPAAAQTTYVFDPVNNNVAIWGNKQEWTNAAAPVSGTTIGLVFSNSLGANSSNNLTDLTVNSWLFVSQATAANVVIGNAITLTGGITNNSTSLQTVNLNIATTAARTINTASGNMSLGGVISGAGGGITKDGANTLTLGGANTFTGTLSVLNGTLSVATINNANAAGVLGNSANAVVLGGSGTTGQLLYTGATASSTKSFSLASGGAGNINVGTAATALTLSGAITNTGSFIKSGVGTLILSGANTYTGTTTISAGTLQVGNGGTSGTLGTGTVTNNAALVFNRSDSFSVTNTVSGTGAVTKQGAGTLALSGANTFSGALAVQAGVLDLASATGQAAGSAASLSVSTGATLLISQANQVNDSAAVTLSGGTIARGGNVGEVFGNLNLTTASFLDYGAANQIGTIRFGTYTPSSLLTVQNFLPGNKLQFGNTISLADLNNTSLFQFSNGFTTSTESGFFTITAIPEPSTYAAAAGLVGLMLWPTRKRLLRDAKKILGLTAPMRDRLAARRSN